MSEKNLAKLVVRLEAQNAKYMKGMEQARKETSRFRKKATVDMGAVKGVFASFIAVFSVGKVAGFYQQHAAGIDQLAKHADKLNITTQGLQGLRHVGELSGVAVSQIDMALQRMTRRLSEAAKGTGEAKGALLELGLEAEQVSKLPLDEQFYTIARAMGNVESQSDKVRLATKLFDSEGVALVNTLNMGEEGLRNAAREVETFGAAVTRVDAAKIEAANDQFTRVNLAIKGVGQRMAVETAPLVAGIAELFLGAAKESAGMGNTTSGVSGVMQTVLGRVANVVHFLRVGFLTVKQVIGEVGNSIVQLFDGLLAGGEFLLDKIGMTPESIKGMRAFAEAFDETVQTTRQQLVDLASAPLPGDAVRKWVQDVYATAQSEAEKIAREKSGLGAYLWEGLNQDPSESSEIKTRQEVNARLEEMQRSHFGRMLHGAAYYEQMRSNWAKSGAATRVAMVAGEIYQMAQMFSGGSKRMFRIMKLAGITNALISTYQGIAAGVKLGWPMAIPAVAWASLKGYAMVRNLKAMTYGGGGAGVSTDSGSVSSVGSEISSASAAVSDAIEGGAAESRGQTNIYLQGDMYGYEGFQQKIVQAVAEASNNNTIRISDSSGRMLLEVV